MQQLLLLHGAIGASQQLMPLADQLSGQFKVHTLDFSGHGGKAMPDTPFSIELFADDVLQFMEKENLDKVSVFGYSMGGYVGMYLAKNYPEKIDKVITLATKYDWTPEIAVREIQMLNPDKIEQKVPAFAETLKQRHAPNDWKKVMHKTTEMISALGENNTLTTEDYAGINTPSMILLGDRDKMVSLEETVSVYKALPNAQMCILPATQHPIEQVNKDLLTFIVKTFLV
jgi:pimeloyl-ACP methyl ester carboxylesterase